MRRVSLAEEVALDPSVVWPVIGDFGGIRKWATLVEKEDLESTPEGKVRVLTMRGREIRELLVDEGPSHYTYSLVRPDMKIYRSTVAASPAPGGSTMIELTVTFDPAEGIDPAEATNGFIKFFEGNLKAMKRALGAG